MDYNALLTQLGYHIDDATIAQVKRILNNTNGLTPQDAITLNDHLKPHRCFVAMSGSEDRLKIKNIAATPEARASVDEIISEWSQKHKIQIKKINDTTHYIIGRI